MGLLLTTSFPALQIFQDALSEGNTIQEYLEKLQSFSVKISNRKISTFILTKELRILAKMGYQNKVLKLTKIGVRGQSKNIEGLFVEDVGELLFLMKLHMGDRLLKSDQIDFHGDIKIVIPNSYMVVDLLCYRDLNQEIYDEIENENLYW